MENALKILAKKVLKFILGEFFMITNREKEVLELLMLGKTNKEIAKELCITSHTVKAHLEHLYEKYKVHSRFELAIKILKHHE